MTQFWYKPEENAAPVLFNTEASIPKGWIHVPGSYDFQTGQWSDVPKPNKEEDIEELRALYELKFNEAPDLRWSISTLKKKL